MLYSCWYIYIYIYRRKETVVSGNRTLHKTRRRPLPAFAGGGESATARLSPAAVDIAKAYIDLLKAIIKLPPVQRVSFISYNIICSHRRTESVALRSLKTVSIIGRSRRRPTDGDDDDRLCARCIRLHAHAHTHTTPSMGSTSN